MNDLLVAAVFFVGTHLGIASTQIRGQIIDRVGEGVYRLLYSLISIVALVWMITAFGSAPFHPLWTAGPGFLHLPLVVMPLALLLVVCGVSGTNPTAVGQAPDPDAAEPARGILRITRHPVMWGIGLWAIVHTLANPDVASIIFFGALGALALVGAHAQDLRRTRENPPGWGVYLQRTSYVPFGAIVERRQKLVLREIGWQRAGVAALLFAALLLGHPLLFGVTVLP